MDEYQSESYQQTMMSHARCMVCGTHNPDSLGIRFYQREEGATEGLFIADQRHQGYSNILHGGMTSTLLDAVMTHALLQRGIRGLTAELTVRFIAPIDIGSKVALSARIVDQRHGIYRLNAVASVGGMIVAKASAKFIKPKANNRS